MSKSKVVWCERGLFPSYFGFCPNKKAWDKEMDRMVKTGEKPIYPPSDASVSRFTNDRGKQTLIVTMDERFDKDGDAIAVCGLMVHEAMHVLQYILSDMHEDKPSIEFEAYAIQFIFQQLMDAYNKTRKYKPK